MAVRPAADFDAKIAQIDEIRVNVKVLGNFEQVLAGLGGLVPYTRADVQKAHDALRALGGNNTASALGSSEIDPVGRPEAGDGLLRRLKRTHEAVMANLADVASSLEYTAKAVRQIAVDFDTEEERNQIAASEIQKRLRRKG